MESRGEPLHPGPVDSARRAKVLHALEAELADLPFPLTKRDLLALKGSARLAIPDPSVGKIPLRSFIAPLNTTTFTSPRHVSEVVKINWQDFADVFTLGAGETRPPDLTPREPQN